MTADPSSFRDEDLLAVHGPAPTCFQTAKRHMQDGQPVDKHHIYGRGGKDPEDRRIHSSVLNCAIIRRDIHHGPMRDRPAQREAYLDAAIDKVFSAAAGGDYELRDEDRAFLQLYRPGMLDGC